MDDKVKDWQEAVSTATARYLQSTLPFDSNKAVIFVSERAQKSRRADEGTNEGKTPVDPVNLTGDEAKQFYDEVLAMPEQRGKLSKAESNSRQLKLGQKEGEKFKKSIICRDNKKKQTESTFSPFQPFQYAQNNQLDLLKSALSDQHFDVNLQDNFHWTLLMVAAYAGHMTIVEYLMGQGARWREYTERGMNAADLARTKGYLDIAEFIESHDPDEDSLVSSGDDITKDDTEHFCVPSSNHSMQKRRDRLRKRSHSFYCDSCQTTVDQQEGHHATSIVHLYSNQWQPPNIPSYGIPESNRGFQMMLRSGWDPEKGLGSRRQGKMFPVKTVLKKDRSGVGSEKEKARVTHFSAHDKEAVRSHRDRYKKKQPLKRKKDIIQEKQKERQWERRIRTIMNIDDSSLLQ